MSVHSLCETQFGYRRFCCIAVRQMLMSQIWNQRMFLKCNVTKQLYTFSSNLGKYTDAIYSFQNSNKHRICFAVIIDETLMNNYIKIAKNTTLNSCTINIAKCSSYNQKMMDLLQNLNFLQQVSLVALGSQTDSCSAKDWQFDSILCQIQWILLFWLKELLYYQQEFIMCCNVYTC